MKGIVFTEFLEMVEKEFGLETVDHIITKSELDSNGAYTAVGTYPHSEMVNLIGSLKEKTGLNQEDLLKAFGMYLFGTFKTNYPDMLSRVSSAFELLESIEDYIHVEVKKLYPDAELPTFNTEQVSDKELVMIYSSQRKMGSFALGLIKKTLDHYNEEADIKMEKMAEDGSVVKFTLTKR